MGILDVVAEIWVKQVYFMEVYSHFCCSAARAVTWEVLVKWTRKYEIGHLINVETWICGISMES